MRNRHRGFTLIELLMVIGILLLLMGILLPVFAKATRQSQILTQKMDFQTIASALDNYKQDFGDYPKDTQLPSHNSIASGPSPIFLSLATALLGPGPALYNSTTNQGNDGADGFGFRAQTRVVGGNNVPTGKVWGPYLQSDKFKVRWQPQNPIDALAGPGPIPDQPMLLDRFGSPIQYYTAYGPYSNRTIGNTNFPPPPTAVGAISAGPLYGSSETSIATDSFAQFSIFDFRNGTLSVGGSHCYMAFQWMLGDNNIDNVIDSTETLRFNGPYILISAGPDATFCDLSAVSPSQYSQAFTSSGNIYNFDRN